MRRFLKYPKTILTVILLATLFFAYQLKDISIDNGIRIYFPQNHPSYIGLVNMEDRYGGSELIGVVLEDKKGHILTADNLKAIQNITGEVENLEQVSEVQSLTNVDYLFSDQGTMAVVPLVDEDFSGTEEEVTALKNHLADWPEMYNRMLVSDNFEATQMIINLNQGLNPVEKQTALDGVRAIVQKNIASLDLRATYVGDPRMAENAGDFMRRDMLVMIPLVILVVIICLYLSFRTWKGTLLPLLTVLISTIWSLGIMALCQIQFTIVSTVIPVALIGVGSAYGIHVLNHYYHKLREAPQPLTPEGHFEVVLAALGSVRLPVSLAGITTIAGFMSLITSPLTPLRWFSLFTSIGIALALLLSVTMIPALLLLLPYRKQPRKKLIPLKKPEEEATLLYKMYSKCAGTPRRLLILILLIIAVAVPGIMKLHVETAFVNYFPKDCQMRQDVNYVDKLFAGTTSIYLLVEGKEKGDLNNPEILMAMEELQKYLRQKYQEVGKEVSMTTFVKRLNLVMHTPEEGQENPGGLKPAEFNEIPHNPQKYNWETNADLKKLITQYLLLFSGSLDKFANDSLEPSAGRILLQLRTRSSTTVGQILEDADNYVQKHFPKDYKVTALGTAELENNMTSMIVSSQAISLLMALFGVFLIVAISFRSAKIGLLGCIPLSLTIAINYMLMGFVNIQLDMFTSLIASLGVGIGIDYTIHFLTGYREERRKSDDLTAVTMATFRKSGKGIVTNAIAVGAGFLVLCFSNFIVLRYIGLLVAAVMFDSSFLALTIIPGVLNYFDMDAMKHTGKVSAKKGE